MTQATHALITQFFADLGAGKLAEEMFTGDATAWTVSTRTDTPASGYRHATGILASLFPEGITYSVLSVIAEGDHAAARVVGRGRLHDGKDYENDYVHTFELRGGRIARLEEFFDPRPVDDLIMPLLIAAMSGRTG